MNVTAGLIVATALATTVGAGPRVAAEQPPLAPHEADVLFAGREDLTKARRAAEIWADAVQRNPLDFESACKLARARDWLGDHVPKAEQSAQYALGMEAARLAIAARPNRPEGYFWLGSNMGKLADLGFMAGVKYFKAVREAFERAESLEPGFGGGSALTALGEWYLRVPGIVGGDKDKAEALLRRALTYDPASTVTHYLLANALLSANRKEEARAELQSAIDAPIGPDWIPEDRESKQKAREQLQKLGASK
jgi:tetratricopeptide (TPR) repeat protein